MKIFKKKKPIRSKIGQLTFGVDIKRCDECEYRNGVRSGIRDYLLIEAGRTVEDISELRHITLPKVVDGGCKVATILIDAVDNYMTGASNISFDSYISDIIVANFGNKESED